MTRSTRLFFTLLLPFALLTAACAAETDSTDPESLPAENNNNADGDEETESTAEELTALSYANVGPIISANCGGCHMKFKTLAGIKQDRTRMIGMLSAGVMPRGNPGFKDTAKGKKVLKWLKSGPNLH